MTSHPTLTTASGIPVADNQNSQTAGPRGPVLLQDVHLIEKLAHFNREVIPERRVHAKGSAAFGTFRLSRDLSHLTQATFLQGEGTETPVFLRFSTVGGERGSADTERDPRGFALRFYTAEGNCDIVGNNTPVFFIRDAIKFPDFIHTQKRHPHTNLKDAVMKWDFWSHSPEALHQITILYSDRGIPDGYRHMHGFGSHAYSLINAQGERVWIKWHFRTRQGIRNLLPEDAARLAGTDPDYAQRDLVQAIERGDCPRWGVFLQTATDAQLQALDYNPFDVTKVWSQKTFPLLEVGEFTLNRNPDNYFADVEQAALSPSNIVPGVGYSPDRMLQGRIFAYADAQRHRVGTNYQHLPVNAARCPVHTYQRDGAMRFDGNGGTSPNYEPNSHADTPREQPRYETDPGFALEGTARRYDHREDDDHYAQAGDLYRLLPDDEKARLVANIGAELRTVHATHPAIVARVLGYFEKADVAYARGIAQAAGLTTG